MKLLASLVALVLWLGTYCVVFAQSAEEIAKPAEAPPPVESPASDAPKAEANAAPKVEESTPEATSDKKEAVKAEKSKSKTKNRKDRKDKKSDSNPEEGK